MYKIALTIVMNESGLALMRSPTKPALTLRDTFSHNLVRIRREQGLSRNQLSRRTHLRASSLYRIEKGITNARLETIEKLAEALHVHPSELFH